MSCGANPTITWLLVGDQLPAAVPPNVRLLPTSFASYIDRVSAALHIRFAPKNPYKLCDIKPALGLVHADDLKDSDWWGFGDHDVIYGNLRQFLPEAILQTKSLISCHAARDELPRGKEIIQHPREENTQHLDNRPDRLRR